MSPSTPDSERRRKTLDELCESFELLAIYLFGPGADDGLRRLEGGDLPAEGLGLNVGVFFRDHREDPEPDVLSRLQAELEKVFQPLKVNLVPLDAVNPLSQYEAIEGHRVAEPDSYAVATYELIVMSMAEEMLWLKRQMEEDSFFRPS